MVFKLIFTTVTLLIFSVCIAQTNYANLYNWASHPYKKDVRDSVPKPLITSIVADSSIDIFFIHPTTYTDAAKEFGQNAIIESEALNIKTDNSTILYQ